MVIAFEWRTGTSDGCKKEQMRVTGETILPPVNTVIYVQRQAKEIASGCRIMTGHPRWGIDQGKFVVSIPCTLIP